MPSILPFFFAVGAILQIYVYISWKLADVLVEASGVGPVGVRWIKVIANVLTITFLGFLVVGLVEYSWHEGW